MKNLFIILLFLSSISLNAQVKKYVYPVDVTDIIPFGVYEDMKKYILESGQPDPHSGVPNLKFDSVNVELRLRLISDNMDRKSAKASRTMRNVDRYSDLIIQNEAKDDRYPYSWICLIPDFSERRIYIEINQEDTKESMIEKREVLPNYLTLIANHKVDTANGTLPKEEARAESTPAKPIEISDIVSFAQYEELKKYIVSNGSIHTYDSQYEDTPYYRFEDIDVFLNPTEERRAEMKPRGYDEYQDVVIGRFFNTTERSIATNGVSIYPDSNRRKMYMESPEDRSLIDSSKRYLKDYLEVVMEKVKGV